VLVLRKPEVPSPPATTQLARFGPQILLGVPDVGYAYAFYATHAPGPKDSSSTTNLLRTPGVRNVEQAYANGGGTTTYQPAYGGSTKGNRGANGLRQGAATGLNDSMNSEHIGEEQRLV
jgi:hypothetical protein